MYRHYVEPLNLDFLIHIGLGALLTPTTSLDHLQSVFSCTVIQEINFVVRRRSDSRLTVQNVGLKFTWNQGNQNITQ